MKNQNKYRILPAAVLGLASFASQAQNQPGVVLTTPQPMPAADMSQVMSNQPEVMAKMPFSRTIAQILTTAGAPSTPQAQAAFLSNWMSTLNATSFKNHGVNMPLSPRKEALLDPVKLLDPTSDTPMIPAAVTYRLDRISLGKVKDGSESKVVAFDCGEVRASYSMGTGGSPAGRMTWIFEAKIPNPNVDSDPKGCVALGKFFQSLGAQTPAEQAVSVEKLLYTGISNKFGPVINFNNYAGATAADGTDLPHPSGQIRANMFVQQSGFQPWMLREWQLVLENGKPVFRTQSVADTPLPALFQAPVFGEDPKITNLRTGYQNNFINKGLPAMVSIEQQLAANGQSQITDNNFLSALSAPVPRKYCAGESIADGSNNPDFTSDPLFKFRVQDAIPVSPMAYPVTVSQIFNRVHNAGVCAGCHQSGIGNSLAQASTGGRQLVQPNSNGFVQIREPINNTLGGEPSEYMMHVLPARLAFTNAFVEGKGVVSPVLSKEDMVTVGETFRLMRPMVPGAAH